MMKFAHISNYSDLMGFTIFECGSGYQEKISNSCMSAVWDFCFARRVRILSAFFSHVEKMMIVNTKWSPLLWTPFRILAG